MSATVFDISDAQPSGRVQELIATGRADGFILKLGETLRGTPTLDDRFIEFVNDVVAAGLPYGIYYVSHALTMDKFIEEAQFINDKVAELLNGVEPVLGTWWDMEVDNVKRNDIWPQLRDAIGTMEDWWKSNKIGIYASTYSYIYPYLPFDELKKYNIPLWPAQYDRENDLKRDHPDLRIIGWQFTDNNQTQDENKWYGFE